MHAAFLVFGFWCLVLEIILLLYHFNIGVVSKFHHQWCKRKYTAWGSNILGGRVAFDPTSLTLVHPVKHLVLCALVEQNRGQCFKSFIFSVTNFYYCIAFVFSLER